MALSIGKTRENDDIFPMIYRKTFVLPILFHHPQDESAQQLMNVLMDTLMGSNGHLVGFSCFFSSYMNFLAVTLSESGVFHPDKLDFPPSTWSGSMGKYGVWYSHPELRT
jgi:hypothetical protein